MNVALVVPAAGAGARMGGVSKAFLHLAGEPMLLHALRPFLSRPDVTEVVVALGAADARDPPDWLRRLDGRVRVVAGGEQRGDSVRAALACLGPDARVVVIHDAARPLVSARVIDRAIEEASRGRSVVACAPVTDTIQQVDERDRVVATPDRRFLRAAQTPQAFPREVIVAAYARAHAEGVSATDDAALVARYGGAVFAVEGDRENFKVTTPVDVAIAELLLRRGAA